MELLVEAIGAAGYAPGRDVAIGLDPATVGALRGRSLRAPRGGERSSRRSWSTAGRAGCDKYPIVSLEDGMAEDDWDGWTLLTERLGGRVQLVGDDIFVTNTERLQLGFDRGVANAILIKLNQIGTVTETLDTIALAHVAQLPSGDQPPQRRDRGHVASRTWQLPSMPARSRPARRRVRSASPSTTGCCASSTSSASAATYAGHRAVLHGRCRSPA